MSRAESGRTRRSQSMRPTRGPRNPQQAKELRQPKRKEMAKKAKSLQEPKSLNAKETKKSNFF